MEAARKGVGANPGRATHGFRHAAPSFLRLRVGCEARADATTDDSFPPLVFQKAARRRLARNSVGFSRRCREIHRPPCIPRRCSIGHGGGDVHPQPLIENKANLERNWRTRRGQTFLLDGHWKSLLTTSSLVVRAEGPGRQQLGGLMLVRTGDRADRRGHRVADTWKQYKYGQFTKVLPHA